MRPKTMPETTRLPAHLMTYLTGHLRGKATRAILFVAALAVFWLLPPPPATDAQEATPAPQPTVAPTLLPATPTVVVATATPVATATATSDPTAEPTSTPSPTAGATTVATATATPTSDGADAYEPNDTVETATTLHLGQPLADLTLDPAGDRDYFRLYLKAGQRVRAATFPAAAADTHLAVTGPGGAIIGASDDRSETDLGSVVVWQAGGAGWYLLEVTSSIPFGGGYRLQAALVASTPTPTPLPTGTPLPSPTPRPTGTVAPTATPITQPDEGEPNNRPEDALTIVPGREYAMTLGPAGHDDHDFYRLLAKAGVAYRCAAADPDGVDPALRVYAGAIGAGVEVAANDDVGPGDVGSAVVFSRPITAPVYLVVEARAGYGSYTFSCRGGASVSHSNRGTAGTGASPARAPTPAPETVALTVGVYLGGGGDETGTTGAAATVADLGAGRDGLLVVAVPPDRAWTLARYTRDGEVLLTEADLRGASEVLITVPYLHYRTRVDPAAEERVAVVVPAPELPVMLP